MARWSIFVGIMAVLIAVLLWNDAALDSSLWRATRWVFGNQDRYNWEAQRLTGDGMPWYRTTPPPFEGKLFGRVERIVWVFRDFGEFGMTLILIVGVGIFHAKRWKAAVAVFAATALTGGVGALLAAICGRLRPDGKALPAMLASGKFPFLVGVNGDIRNDGYNYWEFLRGLHGGGDLSFPSGHATLAFATAAALGHFYPRGRGLFLVVAGGCALTRVILQAHFYADILAGATIGLALGTCITVLVDGL